MLGSDGGSLFVTADSTPLFSSWFATTVGAAVDNAIASRGRRAIALYVGAANGDQPEFYGMFEAAVESLHTRLHTRHVVCASTGIAESVRCAREEAALIVLSGGDVQLGWRAISSCGLASALKEAHAAGCVILGVSAGAIHMGTHGFHGANDAYVPPFECLGLCPYCFGAHEEADGWAMTRRALDELHSVAASSDRAVVLGIPFGACAALHGDGSVEPFLKPLVLLQCSADAAPVADQTLAVGARHAPPSAASRASPSPLAAGMAAHCMGAMGSHATGLASADGAGATAPCETTRKQPEPRVPAPERPEQPGQPVAAPADTLVDRTQAVAAPADALVDDGVEWQSLPCSLFDDANLVPSDCASFALDVGGASPVTVAPERRAFERRDAPPGAAGTGADECRMTGALLWDASVVLASWLVRNRAALTAALARSANGAAPTVVELGAGLGLAGLTAAATLGVQAALTDRSEVLPLLQRGIAANGLHSVARAAPLEWGDVDAARALGPCALVLACDCVYEQGAQALLCTTIAALLSRGGSALVAFDEAIGRPQALDAFRAHAARHFLWEDVDAASQDGTPPPHAPLLKSSVKLVRLSPLRAAPLQPEPIQ